MDYRVEWIITEMELVDEGPVKDVIKFIRYEVSGQKNNHDGTWTEVMKQRGMVDLPYNPDTPFVAYDGISQEDMFKNWVFPIIDAPLIEDNIFREIQRKWVKHPEREENIKAALEERPSEWVAKSTITPREIDENGLDLLGRTEEERLPKSFKHKK